MIYLIICDFVLHFQFFKKDFLSSMPFHFVQPLYFSLDINLVHVLLQLMFINDISMLFNSQ